MKTRKKQVAKKYNGKEWVDTPEMWRGSLEDKWIKWWDKKTKTWIDIYEVWKPLHYEGGINEWYSVSNTGRVVSHLKPGRGKGGYGGADRYTPDYNRERLFQISTRTSKNGFDKEECCRLDITFPDDYFEKNGSSYRNNSRASGSIRKTCTVHELIIETHNDIEENPPERLKEEWFGVITPDMVGQPRIPSEARQVIKESLFVDHVDHDPLNNAIINLERVTPRENTKRAKEHHGGSFLPPEKRSKSEDDEFIVITPPKRVRTVFEDTWVDGTVEFIGEEGEEVYKMVQDIADFYGISGGEAFWGCTEHAYEQWIIDSFFDKKQNTFKDVVESSLRKHEST